MCPSSPGWGPHLCNQDGCEPREGTVQGKTCKSLTKFSGPNTLVRAHAEAHQLARRER